MARISGVDLPREKRVEIGLTFTTDVRVNICLSQNSLRTGNTDAVNIGKTYFNTFFSW